MGYSFPVAYGVSARVNYCKVAGSGEILHIWSMNWKIIIDHVWYLRNTERLLIF